MAEDMAGGLDYSSELDALPKPPPLRRAKSSLDSQGESPRVGGGTTGGGLLQRSTTITSVLSVEEAPELIELLPSVCQVFTNSQRPSFQAPWTNDQPSSCTGSAFILSVEKRLVVTNAHCVEFARVIRMRREGADDKFQASLIAISHQVDLALLTVQDDEFWKTSKEDERIAAVVLGDLPRMQQSVDVVGFPVGGDSICITTGVVSRIDFTSYSHSHEENLVIQVDAAINGGNSGGPAFSDGKLVGVAFQGMSGAEAQNVGYIIPITVLRRFLEDFDQASTQAGLPRNTHEWGASSPNVPVVALKGFAQVVFGSQLLESQHLRAYLKLPAVESGIAVRHVPAVSNLAGLILDGDVLTMVDEYKVTKDGRVTMVPGIQGAIDFAYVISSKLVGEEIRFVVFRRGQRVELTALAENPAGFYQEKVTQLKFSYVQFAGLVFSTVFNYGCGKSGGFRWDGMAV